MVNEKLLYSPIASAFYGNFRALHKIQDIVIPPILDGKNIILSAGTGSGKTEAVMAPLISRYYSKAIETDSIVILYIAPTKALVNDLHRRLQPYLAKLYLRLGIRHGDRDDLKHKNVPHILITTPESLDVMLFKQDKALKNIHAVVVDEVHLLYNTQRGLQLSILLQRLRQNVDHTLQFISISATMSDSYNIRYFLFGNSEKTEFFNDSTARKIDAQIRVLDSLSQLKSLFTRIFELNRKKGKYLIFANSRRECERVAESLNEEEIFRSLVRTHYSSISAEIRKEVETFFNQSDKAICIATNTLELGIDIGDIDAVFLYGPPPSVESFLQRIGRSNRKSSKVNVVCFVRPECVNPYIEALIFHSLIELAKEGHLPEKKPYLLYGAAAQQMLSYIGSVNGEFTRTSDLAQFCAHLPHLNHSVLEKILGSLAEHGYLKAHGFKYKYGAGQKLYKLIDYRIIYGNFPLNSQNISLFHRGKILGFVSYVNILKVERGSIIRFAGNKWQVKSINKNEGISVIPITSKAPAIDIINPGSVKEIDTFILENLIHLACRNEFDLELYPKGVCEEIQKFVMNLKKLFQENRIPFCKKDSKYIYFTLAGSLVNKAIALITYQSDFEITDSLLSCTSSIDWFLIPTDPNEYEIIFSKLFEADSSQTFYQSLIPLEYQELERRQSWFCDSTVVSHLQRLQKSKPVEVRANEMKDIGLL